MATQNNTNNSSITMIELSNEVSGLCSSTFWKTLYESTTSPQILHEILAVFKTLYQQNNYIVAYNLILALYDILACPIPSCFLEFQNHSEAIPFLIKEFVLDAEDIILDYDEEN